jgi:hypothetical protein
MPRRVTLPGASELFRPTQPAGPASAEPAPVEPAPAERASAARTSDQAASDGAVPRGSGRVRHDEKITVYVSRDELLALEQARLTLRRDGLAVDRGRIVREAIAALLSDHAERGPDSELVRRLSAPEAGPPA